MGEELAPGRGAVYAYLIEEICWACYEPLDNDRWCPIRSAWVTEQFDTELHAAGVTPELFGVSSHLLHRGCPFPIPEPEDRPTMGHLLPAGVPAAADALAGLDPERFRAIDGHEQFAALREWLEACRVAGHGRLCFYH